MFIGICGGICAGKHTVAQYLVDHHGFKRLYLQQDTHLSPSAACTDAQNHAEAAIEDDQTIFSETEALVDFVTKRWRIRYVTTSIHTEHDLDVFLRRPFFILISVDAPVSTRYRRHVARATQMTKLTTNTITEESHDDLETFLAKSDKHLYDPQHGLLPLISRATIRLLNTSSSLSHLYATLGTLDLTNSSRLRPSWDQYFMTLASLASHRSNCMKRRVGCVLTLQNRVLSTGYNGTPRHLTNCNAGGCSRCNTASSSGVSLSTCLCLHAEENALLEAGRERIGVGSVLYCDTCPCLTCSIKIVQCGVAEVVFSRGYSMDSEAARVFGEAGVRLRQFVPPADGLVHLENLNLR